MTGQLVSNSFPLQYEQGLILLWMSDHWSLVLFLCSVHKALFYCGRLTTGQPVSSSVLRQYEQGLILVWMSDHWSSRL